MKQRRQSQPWVPWAVPEADVITPGEPPEGLDLQPDWISEPPMSVTQRLPPAPSHQATHTASKNVPQEPKLSLPVFQGFQMKAGAHNETKVAERKKEPL